MAITLNELREQRNGLTTGMRATLDAGWDAQTEERFDKMDADLKILDRQIEAHTRANQVAADTSAVRGEIVASHEERSAKGQASLSPDQERRALLAWMRGTTDELEPELRAYTRGRVMEARAQSIGTNSAGGFLTNSVMAGQIEVARRAYGSVINLATHYPTSTGSALLIPTLDDTSNSGAILAENAQASEVALTFAQTSIPSYMYTSGLVLVSYQLLQDAEFPLDSYIATALGERLGRIQNTHFTTGSGSSQPSGIVTGAATGITASTGGTASPTYSNLVDLVFKVDAAYRPNAKWMLRDSSVGVLRKILDGQNRPIWEPSMQANQPDTLLGYPVVTNNDVAAQAANAKSIYFGDFSKYAVRDVTGMNLVRMDERYADYLQVAFLAYMRTGGALIAANTTTYNPVQLFINSAT